jgi:hypothetical protein
MKEQLNLGWAWSPFGKKGGEAMEVKDAITIMILFSTFIVVLLTYISNNNKRK